MRRFDRLKREARDATIERGHTLSIFRTVARPNPTMGIGGRVAVAECAECGAWVRVETRPTANGIDIGGNAVAINCERPKRTRRHPFLDRTIVDGQSMTDHGIEID